MSNRPVYLRPLPAPPIITIASRCSIGASVSRTGSGAAASGASPFSDAASSGLAFPFVLDVPTTIYKAFWTNGSSAGSTIGVGLYDSDYKLIVQTAGDTGSGANAPQAVAWASSATPTVPPGLYYAMLTCNATNTGRFHRWSVATKWWQAAGCFREAPTVTAGSMPTTASPTDITNAAFPLFGVITRTVFDA